MNLTAIDTAIDAAFASAKKKPKTKALAPVGDAPGQTVRTDVFDGPAGSGFVVTGEIKVGGYSAQKVRAYGPGAPHDTDWPAEGIEAAAEKHVSNAIALAASKVIAAGFDADRKVILLAKLIKAQNDGTLAMYPRLVATYAWMSSMQDRAVAGAVMFPRAPFTFEEVITE